LMEVAAFASIGRARVSDALLGFVSLKAAIGASWAPMVGQSRRFESA
jgi:hypothetical protein